MRLISFKTTTALLAMILLFSATANADLISIGGTLEITDPITSETVSLAGVFDWQLVFYQDLTTTTQIGAISSGTLLSASGVFSIEVDVSGAIIALPEVWYELAVDIDQDGIDSQDWFTERFKIVPVPYALTGTATEFFITHSGGMPGFGVGANPSTRLNVSPFMTPAGGVRFNTMSMRSQATPGIFSFGIYDANGVGVALSPAFNLVPNPSGTVVLLHEFPISGFLQPSSLYYTGWTASSDTMNIVPAPTPPINGYGIVTIPESGGLVPTSFDPNQITDTTWVLSLPVGLRIK